MDKKPTKRAIKLAHLIDNQYADWRDDDFFRRNPDIREFVIAHIIDEAPHNKEEK